MTFLICLPDALLDAFSCFDRLEWRTKMEEETLNPSEETLEQSKYLELELMMRPA